MSEVRDRLSVIYEKVEFLKELTVAARKLRADINERYPETAGNLEAVRCPHMREVFAALQKIDDWNDRHQSNYNDGAS